MNSKEDYSGVVYAGTPPSRGGGSLYRCQYCRMSAIASNLDVPRAAGWRIWQGHTVVGKPTEVIVCPTCWDTPVRDAETDTPTGFDAVCDTCGWSASDAPDFDDTEAAAEEWTALHECEPETRVIRLGEVRDG